MAEVTKNRETSETTIDLTLNLEDRKVDDSIDTGVGFFDHMLTLFAAHSQFGLNVSAKGDLEVDSHHTVEDVGIVFGQAFLEALGDKKGIKRYASTFTPMDESLSLVSVDISGRPYLVFDVEGMKDTVGSFDTELVEEFLGHLSIKQGSRSILIFFTEAIHITSLNRFLKDLVAC